VALTTGTRRAVFIDKDGTLIDDVPYNVDPRSMRFTSGAEFCLPVLHEAGYALVIVSNQSGVARGFFNESALVPVRERLNRMFADAGAHLLDFYYCPHHPEGTIPEYTLNCSCRKPQPGLLLKAALDHGIDLASSWVIGDILNDVEAGHRAGCRSILLNNGNETEWLLSKERVPDFLADDLAEAALIIALGNNTKIGESPRVEGVHGQ
jgi:D-glycero-D-manno-heptose 1,7-bisphosphate phosphatase